MANRVTDIQVKKIIDTNISDTTSFIDTAHIMVNQYLSNSGMGNDILAEIEKYLSAHLVALRERQLKREEFGDSEQEFAGDFGKGLDFTQYGQMVKLLDNTGTLSSIGKSCPQMIII